MFKLQFIIKKKSDDVLLLTQSPTFRFFFAGLASFFLFFLIDAIKDNPDMTMVSPLVFILVFLLCACYKEEWMFDRAGRTVESRFGLLFLFKRDRIPLEEIEAFKITNFTKGAEKTVLPEKKYFFQFTYCKLSLVTKPGDVRDIEILQSRYRSGLETKGRTIAEFCSKRFVVE